MFEFVVAASIALSSESVDGIFGKRSSCSNGSCSVAQPAEKKPAAAPIVSSKKEEPKASCQSSSCSDSRRGTFLGRFRRCN